VEATGGGRCRNELLGGGRGWETGGRRVLEAGTAAAVGRPASGGSSRQAGGRLLAASRRAAGGRSSRLLGRLLEAGTHGLDGGRGRQRPERAAAGGGRGGRRQGSGDAKVFAGARASDCERRYFVKGERRGR
jgi:hypothetical protein